MRPRGRCIRQDNETTCAYITISGGEESWNCDEAGGLLKVQKGHRAPAKRTVNLTRFIRKKERPNRTYGGGKRWGKKGPKKKTKNKKEKRHETDIAERKKLGGNGKRRSHRTTIFGPQRSQWGKRVQVRREGGGQKRRKWGTRGEKYGLKPLF